MKVHYIPFQKTGYFSNLINDYLSNKPEIAQFYENYPSINGFKKQLKTKKQSFKKETRIVLKNSLQNQYKNLLTSTLTANNIQLLEHENTFTIVTGHQLNLFTGPLYFLYKIITVINLTNTLKKAFPTYNFIPVYWMATEDHDFDEINYFNFKDKKVVWNTHSKSAVGKLKTTGLNAVLSEFSKHLGNTKNANFLKQLFEDAYLKNSSLTEATRYLVNELFKTYGLVIVDGDDVQLKKEFAPIIKDELLQQTSHKKVIETNNLLEEKYKIQVNPRELNLFYLTDAYRERIIFENNLFKIHGTSLVFTKEEILKELENFPERFSPNVLMRPVYQETILPNLCYVGGGGELAYWLQLKAYFKAINTPFPIVLLRNSALLISEKQSLKAKKIQVTLEDLFNKQTLLIDKKIKEISDIEIDFTIQKEFLQQQFNALKEIAKQTDVSFVGAVNAQEAKQLKGLNVLEKRLLKAQKRKLSDQVNRLSTLQDELFPKQHLEERTRNFSEYYLELGTNLIPMLFNALDPLNFNFCVIEYSLNGFKTK
jgi:bacillithiol biosynthesis cysteine-adding enzyme BshC